MRRLGICRSWTRRSTKKDGLVPYLDWATPTMGDTIGAALQDMLAKQQTPEQAMTTIGEDYDAFTGK